MVQNPAKVTGNFFQAQVHAVVVEGILQLHLSVPADALATAISLDGQVAVAKHHMTLVRLDDLGVSVSSADLPAPPAHIDLLPDTYLVDTVAKRACYLVATDAAQQMLREYTLECAARLGLSASVVDSRRVYHVTLSNAGGGDVRASVGAPWEFPVQLVRGGRGGAVVQASQAVAEKPIIATAALPTKSPRP
jgi:hypothetical protein